MRQPKELVIGRRYYDTETRDYFKFLELREDQATVKFEEFGRPETFDYADLLRDAREDAPVRESIRVRRLSPQSIVPTYQSRGAAGFDFHTTEDVTIQPNDVYVRLDAFYDTREHDIRDFTVDDYMFNLTNNNFAVVGTGLAFEIPEGFELEIRGRSGLGFNHQIVSFNGTIDSDYRGEVKLLIFNLGKEAISFRKGDRIAQGVIKRIEQFEFVEADELSPTARGDQGFGHTGK